jgi:hypothetical protein
MRLRYDRRVALVAFALAGVAIIVTIAVAQGPEPSTSSTPSDPVVRAELLDLARNQARVSWLAEYTEVRRLDSGRELPRAVTEANRPPLHVTSAGGTVTADLGDEVISCTTVDDEPEPQCLRRADEDEVPLAEVYATLTRLGIYRVERADDRTVAGEPTRCYRLVAAKGTTPQFGHRTESCWADDGVPLYSQLVRGGFTDTRAAQRVERDVGPDVVDRLLAQLEAESSATAG